MELHNRPHLPHSPFAKNMKVITDQKKWGWWLICNVSHRKWSRSILMQVGNIFRVLKLQTCPRKKKKKKEKVNDMLAILSIKRVNMDNGSLIFDINPQCSLFFFFTPNAKLLIFLWVTKCKIIIIIINITWHMRVFRV